MKRIIPFIAALLLVGGAFAQTANVTFRVNMANETVDPGGVYLAGGSFFGIPGDNEMLDPDMDGIYEITMAVPVGTTSHYTYLNGNCPGWNCKEDISGLPCADPGNFNDRLPITVVNDTTISTCFNQCSDDGTCMPPPSMFNVTFQVDMTTQTVDPSGVYMGANFDNWSGGIQMTDPDMDGIYEYTTMLAAGPIEWKYINGAGWLTQENLDPLSDDSTCTLTTSGFTNRFWDVQADVVIPAVCWDSCISCNPPVAYNVTFQVDMNQQTVDPGGVFMGANWDNWTGGLQMDDADMDGVYTYTAQLLPGTYEWKYINGPGWAAQEEFDPATSDSTCTLTTGDFTNRVIDVVDMDITIPVVCYDSCGECATIPVDTTDTTGNSSVGQLDISNRVRAYHNLSADEVIIALDRAATSNFRLTLIDMTGRVVAAETVPAGNRVHRLTAGNLSQGVYFIRMENETQFLTKKVAVNK